MSVCKNKPRTISVGHARNIMNDNQVNFAERKKDLEKQGKKDAEAEKEAKKSPFKNFYQINRLQTNNLIALVRKNHNAMAILFFLLKNMDKYNAVACSYHVLTEALEISRSTVAKAVKLLKTTNFIAIYKVGTANVYCVNKTLTWNS